MTLPKPHTPEWGDLLRGVLFANPADRKGWAAILAEANAGKDMSGRARVIRQIQAHGKLFRNR